MEGENIQNGSNSGTQNSGQNMNQGQGTEQNKHNNNSMQNDQVKNFVSKTDNSTVMAMLSYIGPLVLFPYLMNKDNNDFVKFHAKQGIVLFGIEVILWVVSSMMYLWIFLPIVQLAGLVLSIVGIVNVVQKEKNELPIIGGLAKNLKI